MIKLLKFLVITVFILALPVVILLYLQWQYDFLNPDAILPFASFFVTTIVGLAVIYTLKLTRDSLQLTRATQRPFLNVEGSVTCYIYPKSIGRIIAGINNTGNFPANEVSAFCEVRRIKRNTVDNFSLPFEKGKADYPSCCFPGDDIRYFFEREGIEMERDDKLEVHITIKYRNKLTAEKHKTIRAYLMIFAPSSGRDEILSPYPQGDDWD